ncbi:isoprenylcysteine carboxylmethyltransferase family protein [Sinorhizobium fredii]|uniref:isoprenylcysteine carboxylmethyltransferase family protein n=2 Tax=Rhizobium fredii TaxID=380 RepID=UPI0004B434AE|nr:isoprenylcysteine carboxylmethyltransferase family protein [Sinorhizobium fredii]AWM28202.1 GTP-binding protein EngA [Sinorhizobium fredii CCBAU 25509]
MNMQIHADGRPRTVNDPRGITIGFTLLILTFAIARLVGASATATMAVALASYALPIILYDMVVTKVHRRPSTGLDWSLFHKRAFDPSRVAVKLIGTCGIYAMLGIVYASLPPGVFDLYRLFAIGALLTLPILLLASAIYIALIDRVMIEPRDGYFEFGSALLLRFRGRDWLKIRDLVLGWVIKGFFLPQMFGSLAICISRFLTGTLEWNLVAMVAWLANVAVLITLLVAVCGYALTMRLLDTHIRSPNNVPLGWVVCLVCYAPFNALILHPLFPYEDGLKWHHWFGDVVWLAAPWGLMVVAAYGLWMWATIIYGLRWSNLTHRGIITNGPYRFTKHPDYIAKSLFWWLTAVPFLSIEGWFAAASHSLMLIGVNVFYFLRAKTEERHLMQDPVYTAYAAWIAKHGVFARLRARILSVRPLSLDLQTTGERDG